MAKNSARENAPKDVPPGSLRNAAQNFGTTAQAWRRLAGSGDAHLFLDKDDPNQGRWRRVARARHVRTWRGRVSILFLSVIVPALPLWVPAGSSTIDYRGWSVPSPGRYISAGLHLPLHSLLIILIQIIAAASLAVYRHETDRDWWHERNQTQNEHFEKKARAFMELIRMIDRARFLGLAVSLFGITAALSAVYLLAGAFGDWRLVAVFAVQFLLGAILMYRGFDIGRRYVQGTYLASEVMALTLMRGKLQMDVNDALKLANEEFLKLVGEHPEWFYFDTQQREAGHGKAAMD